MFISVLQNTMKKSLKLTPMVRFQTAPTGPGENIELPKCLGKLHLTAPILHLCRNVVSKKSSPVGAAFIETAIRANQIRGNNNERNQRHTAASKG